MTACSLFSGGQYVLSLCIGLALLPAAPAFAAAVPPGAELAARQEIVRQNIAEPASLDPHKAESDNEFAIINDFFERLVAVNDDGTVEPRLAASWEQKQPTLWIFHLRPHLTWSNGDALTARDVVSSWRRLVSPDTASPYASYLANMQVANAADIVAGKKPPEALGIKALDDLTLEIRLDQPLSYFMDMLAHQALAPVNSELIHRWGDTWTQPGKFAGSGPFTLQEWVVNEKVVGVRNGRYWDNEHTIIDKVTFLSLVSENSALNRYRSDEIDIVKTVPEIQFAALKKKLGDEVRISPQFGTYFYDINTGKPPFDDVRVRLALNLGLDREIIAADIMGQGQTPAYMFSAPDIGGFKPAPPAYAHWPRERRIAEGKKLLAQAGFGETRPLKFTLLYNTSETHRRLAIAASSMWKKNLGVEATLSNQEWKTLFSSVRSGNFEVSRTGWYADYSNPATFLNNYRSQDSGNYAKYSNADFDRALTKAADASSVSKAMEYYQEAEDILAKDAPGIPIFYHVAARLVKPYIGGYYETRLGYISTKDLYVLHH
ncbi:oligopeptide ABC transporter substrate-binding protein OppA [Sodalis ligni]|uniref:ABC transporter substrate-binding protein n=1 Tax=Sodalis ligni TaxID=2697027 RepID=UPI00193F7BAC|nr:ABC transporter substrate-binding protein [Sodalis ligni]QWA13277.1 oligopeptide ABC transporter substrate-binding protein OppA [Sodalis ligni]